MHKEILYKTKLLTLLLIQGIIFLIVYVLKWNIPCFFEHFFSIPCPVCYLTASFDALLKFNFISMILINPFSVIILIFLIILNVSIVIDLVLQTHYIKKMFVYFSKHPYLLIIVIGFFWILNIGLHC